MTAPATLAPVRDTFGAVVRAVVPSAESLDASGWEELHAIVERALADRPRAVRRQIVAFLRILGALGRLRLGRSLARADVERVRGFLASVERAPVPLVRRGFWGVRTLALMGYWGRREASGRVGYRADAAGWGARGGGAGPWDGRAGGGAPEGSVLDDDGASADA